MKYDLVELRDAANRACGIAFDNRDQFERAGVNWGDFGCVSAEHHIDDQETEGYRVWIAEAFESPQVQSFIADRLQEMGFEDIEVRFEW